MQQELRFRSHGGARPGAGRKPAQDRRSVGSPHTRRPTLHKGNPVHVTLRVVRSVGSLRTRAKYRALREATLTVARRELSDRRGRAFRIIHASVQRTHIHLIVEADNRLALSAGMQSFQISAARHLNRAAGRRGTVFPDRFHQEIIASPRQARNALAYVMNNWRKHGEDRDRTWNVDPFSTGVLFDGWAEDATRATFRPWRDTYDPLVVYRPRSWLLRVGWRRHALVAWREVPRTR